MTDVSDVVVVGAGLAGLSAAVALAEAGASVTLLERRPEPGGRAYSYPHPALGEVVDSQHVLLGCCTNLIDLLGRSGGDRNIRWYDEFRFMEPGGRTSVMRAGRLPAPSHQTGSFLAAPMLSFGDKAAIARGLSHFLRGYPADDSESFASWLRRTGQTPRAIRHFWEPVVVGTLNDTFDRCSLKYAGKVFHETFLRSPRGGRFGIPALPLTEFFAPVVRYAERLGVRTMHRAGADSIAHAASGTWEVRCGEAVFAAKSLLLATDRKQAQRLLVPWMEEMSAGLRPGSDGAWVSSPITTVHLWYDRDPTGGTDHAALLDTRIQWLFNKTRIRGLDAAEGCYLELSISASWPELEAGRQEILARSIAEFESFFPAAREAKLLRSGVLKEARATFSVAPGLDALRPAQATALPGLYLAGDWTATEWPSTMEGAVRGGLLAAGAVLGVGTETLAPELPASGLMRWLSSSVPPLSRA